MSIDYKKLFAQNPIRFSESMKEYYIRMGKLSGRSQRTVEDQYRKHKNNPIADKLKYSLSANYTSKSKTEGLHIILPCVHIPFENQDLLEKIVLLIEDHKEVITGFHIIGDFLDMLALSKHQLNSVPMKGYSLGIEYELGNAWLDVFDTVLPKDCRKTFCAGNHEDRFDRHFSDINNSIYKDVTLDPFTALNLKQRNFEVYTNWKEDYVMIGNLMLHHGFLLGANPCKQHLDKLKCSNAFAHSHRIGTWFDGINSSYNLGTLADLDSPGMKYASRIERMSWANGFGICYVNSDKSFQMNIITPQKDNSFWFGNKKY